MRLWPAAGTPGRYHRRAGRPQHWVRRHARTKGPAARPGKAGRTGKARGRCAAVVFLDASFQLEEFEAALGRALVEFASGGGSVCFITFEGLQLSRVLKRIFNVPWEPSAYYRTTWTLEPDAGDGGCFAGAEVKSFSAKACSLAKVPPGDRFYGTTPDSRTQSMVPGLAGWCAP